MTARTVLPSCALGGGAVPRARQPQWRTPRGTLLGAQRHLSTPDLEKRREAPRGLQAQLQPLLGGRSQSLRAGTAAAQRGKGPREAEEDR